MGEIRKIGDDYYIEFQARGLKYQQKAGPSREVAVKMLSDVEEKIRQGEVGVIVRDVDYKIFFVDFLAQANEQNPPKTCQRLEDTVNHFSMYLKQEKPFLQKLSELTPKVIEDYKLYLRKTKRENKPLKPQVINLTLLLLRDIMEFAIKLGYISDNPTLHIRWMEWPKSRKVRSLKENEFSLPQQEDQLRELIRECRNTPGKNVRVLINTIARELLGRGVSAMKLCQILQFSDCAKVLYYREDFHPAGKGQDQI